MVARLDMPKDAPVPAADPIVPTQPMTARLHDSPVENSSAISLWVCDTAGGVGGLESSGPI
jgi:hypothetical protein